MLLFYIDTRILIRKLRITQIIIYAGITRKWCFPQVDSTLFLLRFYALMPWPINEQILQKHIALVACCFCLHWLPFLVFSACGIVACGLYGVSVVCCGVVVVFLVVYCWVLFLCPFACIYTILCIRIIMSLYLGGRLFLTYQQFTKSTLHKHNPYPFNNIWSEIVALNPTKTKTIHGVSLPFHLVAISCLIHSLISSISNAFFRYFVDILATTYRFISVAFSLLVYISLHQSTLVYISLHLHTFAYKVRRSN